MAGQHAVVQARNSGNAEIEGAGNYGFSHGSGAIFSHVTHLPLCAPEAHVIIDQLLDFD